MASQPTNEPSGTPKGEISPSVVEKSQIDEESIGTDDNHDHDEEDEEEGEAEEEEGGSGGSSPESSSSNTFPYTRDELVDIISKFYTFLTRLYLPTTAILYPPPGGWPKVNREAAARHPKTPFVYDLIQHLPYIEWDDQQNRHRIHYKCNVVDYSDDTSPYLGIPDWVDLEPSMWPHSFIFANGYESGGRYMILNTATGEMYVEMIRYHSLGSTDVSAFFEDLQRQYESLEIVPIVGVEEMPEDVKDQDGDEMLGVLLVEESDENKHSGEFPTEMDFRWVRHIYRSFGWPGPGFRKEQALSAIEAFKAVREGTANESQEESVRLSVSTGLF